MPDAGQVEDPKRALILFGGKTSQITKDVLSDLHKMKSAVSAVPSQLLCAKPCIHLRFLKINACQSELMLLRHQPEN